MSSEGPEEGEPELEIAIDARRFAGVWANAAQVDAKSDEFTIDFIRVDPLSRARWWSRE